MQVIHYLETLRPQQLLEQMVCTAFKSSADILNRTTYGGFKLMKTKMDQLYATLASTLKSLQGAYLQYIMSKMGTLIFHSIALFWCVGFIFIFSALSGQLYDQLFWQVNLTSVICLMTWSGFVKFSSTLRSYLFLLLQSTENLLMLHVCLKQFSLTTSITIYQKWALAWKVFAMRRSVLFFTVVCYFTPVRIYKNEVNGTKSIQITN